MAEVLNGAADYLIVENKKLPLFLITFDKNGECTSPEQRLRLQRYIRTNRARDVHVYAHGWNNVYGVAVTRYKSFYGSYLAVRDRAPTPNVLRESVFVGIIWPSTELALPNEAAPKIAATLDGDPHVAILADELNIESQTLQHFAARKFLERSEAEELAAVLLPIFARPDIAVGDAEQISVAEVLSVARPPAMQKAKSKSFGFIDEKRSEARAAAVPVLFDPVWLIRIATVRLMKDRAHRVGSRGVGPRLLEPILAEPGVRVHFVGHSYGTALGLAAICALDPARTIDSTLLLQPAISRFCFAADLGDGTPGGYRAALDRVRQPIMATHSDNDVELTWFYQFAVRRRSDYGELKIAGIFDRFKSLGGFGPAGLRDGERADLDLFEPGTLYPEIAGAKIYGLNGSAGRIRGHGDVDNNYTGWAHAALVDGGIVRT